MPKSPKYYFQAPNLNIYLTDSNVPRIGSIYANLKTLASALNPSQIPYIPDSSIKTYTEHHFSDARGSNVDISGGAAVEDATGGTFGSGDLIYGYTSDKTDTYECDVLETSEFVEGEPTKSFIRQSIDNAPDVQNFISEALFRSKKVYMITGLKTAVNLKVKNQSARKQGPELKLMFNATPFGVPLSGGPQVTAKFGANRELSYEKSAAVVFAYRVVRIAPKRNGDVSFKSVDGGLYSVDDDGNEEEVDWEFDDASDEVLRTLFQNAVPIAVEKASSKPSEAEKAETEKAETK